MNIPDLLLLLFYMIFCCWFFAVLLGFFKTPLHYMDYVSFNFVSSSDLKVLCSVVIFLVVNFTFFKKMLETVFVNANARTKTIYWLSLGKIFSMHF